MNNQQKTEEVHLVTSAGRVAFICESVERAMIHMDEITPRPTDWKVMRVITLKEDITPRTNTKSATLHRIAKERGLPIIDIKLAQVG